MNTHDLEAFLAVVETGSIVAASARLNLTQPGVTRRVQNLEELLGAPLLDRNSKPLKPTAAGREAYEHGRNVLRSLEDLKAGARPGQAITGEFRLGITPYLSEAALAGPLDALRGKFPGLTLRINSFWSPRLIPQVMGGEIDVAAVCLPEGVSPPPELDAIPMGMEPLLLLVSPSLDIPNLATLKDLSRHPWIMNQDGCGFRTAIRQQFDAARLPFQVGIEALSSDLRLSLVARGLGIGVLTRAGLDENRLREEFVVLEAPEIRSNIASYILSKPPAGRLALPIEAFRLALQQKLDEIRRS